MLKIRLRRMGAIRQPHYRIVVADARAPRDGAFLETLGSYNPLTDPATININVAKYEEWKSKGAQPTDAVASLVKRYNRAIRLGTQAAKPLTKKEQRAAAAQAAAQQAEATAAPTGDEAMATQSPGGGDIDITAAETGPSESGSHMSEATAEATRDGGEGSAALTHGANAVSESDVTVDAGAGTGPGGQTGDTMSNTSHHG